MHAQDLMSIKRKIAQALYWAWSHAIPIRLQRPQGDAPSLPSALPVAASEPRPSEAAASCNSSTSAFASLPPAADTPATVPCSSGESSSDVSMCEGERKS